MAALVMRLVPSSSWLWTSSPAGEGKAAVAVCACCTVSSWEGMGAFW